MKISAGLLMYKISRNKLMVFLVHPSGPLWKNKDKGAWSIPKGEIEENEENQNFLDVAKREFGEEIGIKINNFEFIELGKVKQKSGKIVYCWAFQGNFDGKINCSSFVKMELNDGVFEFPEVDKGEFFNVRQAKEKINSAQFEFVERLIEILGLKLKEETQRRL